MMKAKDIFSSYFINGWKLDENMEINIKMVDAKSLLVPERFDLACKLYFIDCVEKKRDLSYAKDLYKEHIRAFSNGNFIEPGSENKNTIGHYIDDFMTLINNIKTEGFDNKAVIPVSEDGIILDGAHRTAIAIYYKLDIPIVVIPKIKCRYDYNFFLERGMNQSYLDFIAYQYLQYAKHSYAMCLWPRAYDIEKIQLVEELLKMVKVIYKKEVRLTYHGIEQLMIHLYGNQPWCGNISNEFQGIETKAKNCYADNKVTTVYFFEGIDINEAIELKKRIRDIFKIENHSVHITDTQEESIEASKILLNENSIKALNFSKPFLNKDFINKVFELNKQKTDDNIVISKAVWNLYGYNCDEKISYCKNHSLISKINNPRDYLFYFNVKFASLEYLNSFLTEEKDLKINNKIINEMQNKRRNKFEIKPLINKIKNIDIKNMIFENYYGIKLISLYRIKRYSQENVLNESINNLQNIFENLDETCDYLIMRNWEGFYDDILIEGHNDIDVLCKDEFSRNVLVSKLNAKDLSYDGFHYLFKYKDKDIILDTRILGDGYYDSKWQMNMLKNKKKHPLGFYIMDDENYFYSLAYHAIYQKKNGISKEYLERLHSINPFLEFKDQDDIIKILDLYMNKNKYKFTYTLDKSVCKMFGRVTNQKNIRYPFEIRFKHFLFKIKQKDYYTRFKIFIRSLIIKD